MMESILLGAKKKLVSSEFLVDINFRDAAIGSTTIVDHGQLAMPMSRGTYQAGNTGDGVQNHPTLGKAYYFNGYTYFKSLGDYPHLMGMDYELIIKFINTANNVSPVFATGDYPSSMVIRPGVELVVNQSGDYIQLFSTDAAGGFQRQYIGGPNLNVAEEITVRSVAGQTTMKCKRTGLTSTLSRHPTGGDSYFYLGSTHALASWFVGYISELTIRKL